MNLTSKDFKDGDILSVKFTCDGENISPQLEWSDVPEETKSFAIRLECQRGPGSGHKLWLICDIPKDVREIPQNGPIPGKLLLNDFGWKGYTGPCPSQGEQELRFYINALNVEKLEGIGVFSGKQEDLNRQNYISAVNKVTIKYAYINVKYSKV